MASGAWQRPQDVRHEELWSGATDMALAVTLKTTLEGGDGCDRAHEAERESSSNPLHDVKIRLCPRNILRIFPWRGITV